MSIWDKISDHIGIEKIFRYIEDLVKFYFKPLSFFDLFFYRSLIDKIIQTSFYVALVAGLGYVLIEDITFRELLKILFFEIGNLVGVCLILTLSTQLTSKLSKRKHKIENVIFFCIIAKILLAPFQIIFFGLFINYENYNFYFIHNLIFLIMFLFVFVFSARVFNLKLKYIILNIFLNLFFSNVLAFLIYTVSIDNYSTFDSPYYVDQIMKERIEKSELLSEHYNIPNYWALYKANDKTIYNHFLYTTPFDSISSGNLEQSNIYNLHIKQNIAILDTMIPNLEFRRNQDFYTKLMKLYITIDSISSLSVITYTDNDIHSNTVFLNPDSSVLYNRLLISIPNVIQEMNNEILIDQIEIEQKSYNSVLPLEIYSYFFYPLILIMENENAP